MKSDKSISDYKIWTPRPNYIRFFFFRIAAIPTFPLSYTGYSDVAESLDVSMDEFEDLVVELRLISRELEKRDRIDG